MESYFILLFIATLFLLLGILIGKFKCYWLISGYNTSTKSEKANIDIKSLGKHMSHMCYIISGVNILGIFSNYLFKMSIIPFIIATVAITIFYLFFLQKFDHNPSSKKEIKIVLIVVLFIVLLINIPMFILGFSAPKITVNDSSISLSGGYNANIDRKTIEKITLVDETPKIIMRTNGIGLGELQKGHFKLEGNKKAMLFLVSETGPFIEIISTSTTSNYYINYKDSIKTKEAFENLMAELNDNCE
ncbi:MAG: DUF3784 domain-containing protein [Clostridium sp.]|uniref:DUF3784 domain-containing protein n=1 Tax=Clostridium sp. TaxID=1506 RepID=UPI003068E00F